MSDRRLLLALVLLATAFCGSALAQRADTNNNAGGYTAMPSESVVRQWMEAHGVDVSEIKRVGNSYLVLGKQAGQRIQLEVTPNAIRVIEGPGKKSALKATRDKVIIDDIQIQVSKERLAQ